jgi:hypothetical protein
MTTRLSQFNPGHEIPEKSWAYRLLKRYLFADFGVYEGHDHRQSAAPARVAEPTSGAVGEAALQPSAAPDA